MSVTGYKVLLPAQSQKQPCSEDQEQNIRKPDQQLRMQLRLSTQRVGENNKEKVKNAHDQTEGEAD